MSATGRAQAVAYGWEADIDQEAGKLSDTQRGSGAMLIKPAFAAGAVLSVLAFSPAHSQSATDEQFLSGREFAALSIRGAFGSPTEDWSFYFFSTPSDGNRRSSHYAVRRSGPSAGVLWTDTTRCESLLDVIASMEAMPSPSVSIPGRFRAIPPPPPVYDGVLYQPSFGYAAWNGAAGNLAFGGNVDSPLADWHRRASAKLDACWSHAPPGRPSGR